MPIDPKQRRKLGLGRQSLARFVDPGGDILLQAIEQLGSFVGLIPIEKRRIPAHGHGESAEMVFAYVVAKLQVLRCVQVEKPGAHPDQEKLADLFFRGEFVEGFLRPLFTLAIEMNRTCLLVLVPGERETDQSAKEYEK